MKETNYRDLEEEMKMDSYPFLLALILIAGATYLLTLRRRRRLPPGPFQFPIIGNMLQLGSQPHETISRLEEKYGPLMSIRIGGLLNVVVSSPEMTKEVMHKHGLVFSGRFITEAVKAHGHDKWSVAFMPTDNPLWREMRKICAEQMFTRPRMQASEGLRKERLLKLHDYLQKCCDKGRVIDVGEAAFVTVLNCMSATLLSAQAADYDTEEAVEFKEVMEGVITILGVPNLADFFPILKPFDPQGVKKRADDVIGRFLAKIEEFLNQKVEARRRNPNAPKKNDLMETLIDVVEASEGKFTMNHVTHLMLDLFIGGAETTTTAIEWIMTELVINPDKMNKLKAELKSVVGDGKVPEESDIPRLPYLTGVIKEGMRVHPPGPFSFPRISVGDQEVNGYMIPKGTQILLNLWSMRKDPTTWSDPDAFQPERFLDKNIDIKELLSFGSGRRICPGAPLGSQILYLTMATLVHKFDWKMETGAGGGDHSSVLVGFAVRRAAPLRMIPVKA